MRGPAHRSVLRSFIVFTLVLSAGIATACSVPVFRYALERWNSDVYQVIVFHDGKLTDEQQATVDSLKPEGEAGKKFANVQVHAFDVKQFDPDTDAELIALWESEKTDELPRMALFYPTNSLAHGRIWSGKPSTDAVQNILDSPARREAARRILKGETAVWVFIEGGDKKQDDTKFALLEKNLRKAEESLKLPEIEAKDVADGLVTIDPTELKIRFSTIRLSRDNPQEATFIQMLLRSEDGLLDDEFAGKPMAFPLFGRCRSLYALVGDGIVDSTLQEACAFLIGPCTCEVKAQNEHGVDMLTAVDWEGLIEPAVQIDKELPPLAGLGAFTSTKTDDDKPEESISEAIPKVATANDEHSGGHVDTRAATTSIEAGTPLLLPIAIVVGLAFVGVVIGSVLLFRRKEA